MVKLNLVLENGLTFLVLGDKNSTSSKATAAKKNNTEIISEEDFIGML